MVSDHSQSARMDASRIVNRRRPQRIENSHQVGRLEANILQSFCILNSAVFKCYSTTGPISILEKPTHDRP